MQQSVWLRRLDFAYYRNVADQTAKQEVVRSLTWEGSCRPYPFAVPSAASTIDVRKYEKQHEIVRTTESMI